MSKLNPKKVILASLIFISIALSCNLPGYTASPFAHIGEQEPQVISIRQLQNSSETPVEIAFKNGFPTSVNASIEVIGDDPVSRAVNYLNTYSPLYLLDDEDFELNAHRLGGITNEDVVFIQYYKGLPVYASQIVVSLDGNRVISTTGNLLHDLHLDTTPTLTSQQAEYSARTALSLPPESVVIGETFLTVFSGSLIDDSFDPNPHLGWHVSFGSPKAWFAIVDAHTGNLLYSQDPSHNFDYDLGDAKGHTAEYDCHWFSPEVIDIGDENGIFDDDYLSDLYATGIWRLGYDAYWFYYNRFGRNGFDNNGFELEIYIHSNPDEVAAYFQICHSIDIPDDYAGYDIVVHEFTHGVIDFSSDLNYSYQSGALNESYADTMGHIADDDDWFHGDNRIGKDPGSVITDIRTHPRDHMSKLLPGSDDHGQVHENGTIPSKAAYLIAAGGEHYGYKIIGLGRQKMGDLYYATMISLPSNASFETAANATVARAQSWVGSNGWTQQDVCQVRNAFVSVGILEYADVDCDGLPDIYEDDPDNDFIYGSNDNCPLVANPNQSDNDNDGDGDLCDPDDDNDDDLDHDDNCPWIHNPNQEDIDQDGIGDACEDNDYDNVPDVNDNCVDTPNPNQLDTDGDGIGDVCDLDDDGDNSLDANDNCPLISNPGQEDEDGDGIGDVCDNCVLFFNPGQLDTDSNGIGDTCDTDDDGDGILDQFDNCALVYNPEQVDLDFDGIGFACDDDEEPLLFQGSFSGGFQAPPEAYFTLNMNACLGDTGDSASSINPQVQTTISGLPSTVGVWVTDQYGEQVTKPDSNGDTRQMAFTRLGGDDYFLTFIVSPQLVRAQQVEFEMTTACITAPQPGEEAPPPTPEIPKDTPTATNTPIPPTKTNTPIPPTNTKKPQPPTKTNTPKPPKNGWIYGQVWKDQNASGTKDTTEDWYSGVTVQLGTGKCGSTGFMTTTTDSTGNFQFNNLPPGDYCVTIDIPKTCGTYSIPKTDTKRTITVHPDAGSDAGLFGFAPYIC